MISFTEGIRRAVAKRGADYVYPGARPGPVNSCRYVLDGRPGCIVAAALVEMGVSTSVIRQFETRPADLVTRVLVDASGEEQAAAGAAQIEQDNGHTWGVALATYEEALP